MKALLLLLMTLSFVYPCYGQVHDADSLFEKGRKRLSQGQYEWALQTFLLAKTEFEHTGNREYVAYCEANIGQMYEETGSYYQAFMFLQGALEKLEEINATQALHKLYFSLGRVNNRLEQFQRSNQDFKNSIGSCGLDSLTKSKALNWIGINFRRMGELDSASYYHFQSMHLDSLLGHKEGLSLNYGNLGKVHFFQRDFASALNCYQLAEQLQSATSDTLNLVKTYNRLGEVYLALNEPQQAINWLLNLNHIDFANSYELVKNHELLKQAYEMLKNEGIRQDVSNLKSTLDQRTLTISLLLMVVGLLLYTLWMRQRKIRLKQRLDYHNLAFHKVKTSAGLLEGCQQEAIRNLRSGNKEDALTDMEMADTLTKDIFSNLN